MGQSAFICALASDWFWREFQEDEERQHHQRQHLLVSETTFHTSGKFNDGDLFTFIG